MPPPARAAPPQSGCFPCVSRRGSSFLIIFTGWFFASASIGNRIGSRMMEGFEIGHRHRIACAPRCAMRPDTISRGGKRRHWRLFFSALRIPSICSGHEKKHHTVLSFVAEKEGFEPSRQSPQPTPLAGEEKAANCPGKMGLCSSCCFFPVSLFIQPFMTFVTFLHGIFIIIALMPPIFQTGRRNALLFFISFCFIF